jgi:hypothetical protein
MQRRAGLTPARGCPQAAGPKKRRCHVTIQLIELGRESTGRGPSVRLVETAIGSIWQYTGCALTDIGGSPAQHSDQDLNRVAERAARALQEKVSSRHIHVELVIDPLIPPLGIESSRVLPILTAIAENASASVEPGPGTVIISTWWQDKYAGVDAVGRGGILPLEIRENLVRPGFSTRVAEWDTGFGLHAAMEAASAIAARIEWFEPEDSVCFRLAIPLKHGTPISPPETMVGLGVDEVPSPGCALSGEEHELRFTTSTFSGGSFDVQLGVIQA